MPVVLYAIVAIVLGIFIGMVAVIVCAVLDDTPSGRRYPIPDAPHDDEAEGRGGDLPEIVAPRRRHMPEVGLAREL